MNDNGKENRGSCTAEETESEDALRKRLKEELMSEIDFSRDQSDEDIISLIDEMIIKEKR